MLETQNACPTFVLIGEEGGVVVSVNSLVSSECSGWLALQGTDLTSNGQRLARVTQDKDLPED